MKKYGLLLLVLLSLLATGCAHRSKGPRLYLDNDFYWALGSGEDQIEDAPKYNYQKLPKLCYKNLVRIKDIGNTGKYVWLKVQFEIPQELKGDDLSMLIPYLHFAEELYLNGYYIDDYGVMGEGPEDSTIQEAGLMAHLFDFPESFLNQDGINTVYIKLFALGNASVTSGVFLGERQDAWATSDIMTFWRSRIYIFLEGFMLCVCIFFLLIFIAYKKDRLYFYLSLMSLISMFFFSGFFGGDLPWVGFHGGVTYLTFFKFTKCICFFALEYLFSLFIFDSLKMKHTTLERILRNSWFAVVVLLICFAPTYHSLITISHIVIWFSLVDVSLSIGLLVHKARKGEQRQTARMVLIVLSPFLICVFFDFVIKSFVNNITLPYFSMFGWEITVSISFLYFSTQYNRIAIRLDYLNKNLKNEVEEQTAKLMDANHKLEYERDIAKKDMHMASVVQQKFFHAPNQKFANWDYAVCYEPFSEVSGDLFNFYYDDEQLQGVSVFDASGHGVAASLITMLSENVIKTIYSESRKKHKHLSDVLTDLNNGLIEAKGDVDNFLTGVLISITEKSNGDCKIDIADAGHPYPILFRADAKEIVHITPPPGKESYGPIGIAGIETHYTDFSFEMKKGDILVLYTDGLIETMNSRREEFGKENVGKVLMDNSKKNANSILQLLMANLDIHTGQEMRNDDVTAIILKRK
ncbi:MAG: SpoIIE family protein phosphatase [Treponema sp.]|nr:SpoIIE family protein phosphatase [Treponema sp.]